MKKLFRSGIADEVANFYDVLFKAVGAIGVLIAFFVGINQYRISAERDFKREFYNKQLECMSECLEVTTILSVYPDSSAKFNQALIQFDQLRIGKLNLFADDTLIEKVGLFYSDLNQFRSHTGQVGRGTLINEANDIAKYCRHQFQLLTKIDAE